MEPTIFAHLTKLHLSYAPYSNRHNHSQSYSRPGKVIQDLVHFRNGSITHLTIPPFDDNIMELLRGHVPHLKVCHLRFHLLHVERLTLLFCRLVLQWSSADMMKYKQDNTSRAMGPGFSPLRPNLAPSQLSQSGFSANHFTWMLLFLPMLSSSISISLPVVRRIMIAVAPRGRLLTTTGIYYFKFNNSTLLPVLPALFFRLYTIKPFESRSLR